MVDSFVYYYGDVDAAAEPSAALVFFDSFGDQTDIAPVNFFPVWSGGKNLLHVILQTPVPIDNLTTRYSVRFNMPSHLMALHGVRVNYRLQVSPAPAVATFADVPVGHPQRQFIEALRASGITGGCGGGNYCPDAPLTRGQMAVFLAVALGLHWPN